MPTRADWVPRLVLHCAGPPARGWYSSMPSPSTSTTTLLAISSEGRHQERKVEVEHDRQTVGEHREKKTKADLKKATEIAEINKCVSVFDITQFTDPGMLKEILVPQLDLQLKWHRLRELKWTRRPKFRRYPRSRNNRRPSSLWPPYTSVQLSPSPSPDLSRSLVTIHIGEFSGVIEVRSSVRPSGSSKPSSTGEIPPMYMSTSSFPGNEDAFFFISALPLTAIAKNSLRGFG
ncbi:hypothetical protein B0H14DRAFT_2632599 [Mycena olivaceomarginata]|nr:hypothetical protein B0H14DRAFT_2632599 [Mycena olivaceomarginata]